jgi:hypothetical protein
MESANPYVPNIPFSSFPSPHLETGINLHDNAPLKLPKTQRKGRTKGKASLENTNKCKPTYIYT